MEVFNSTSMLNIYNAYFDGKVNNMYSSELYLNETNSSDAEVTFLGLHLTISDGFVSFNKIMTNEMSLILIL